MNVDIIFSKKKRKIVKIIEIIAVHMIQSILDNKGG